MTIGDLFVPYHCGNGELSELLTADLIRHMLGNMIAVEYGFLVNTLNTSFQPIKDVIVRAWKEIEAGRDRARFKLLSGHDVTLVSFLAGIGNSATLCVTFGS